MVLVIAFRNELRVNWYVPRCKNNDKPHRHVRELFNEQMLNDIQYGYCKQEPDFYYLKKEDKSFGNLANVVPSIRAAWANACRSLKQMVDEGHFRLEDVQIILWTEPKRADIAFGVLLEWMGNLGGLDAKCKVQRTFLAQTRMPITNHLPSMKALCHKDSLANRLHVLKQNYPAEFTFIPASWTLKDNASLAEFQSAFNPSLTYILKPSAGRQGVGIELAQSWNDVEKTLKRHQSPEGIAIGIESKDKKFVFDSNQTVAQVYIDNPALLAGFKFDFRIYVLVSSLEPLTVYVFREGLARLCTQKYVKPTKENLSCSFMHLTNYSLNKQNEEAFIKGDENDSDENRSKRRITTALRQLRAECRVDDIPLLDTFWTQIDDIVSKTMIALYPSLLSKYHYTFRHDKIPSREPLSRSGPAKCSEEKQSPPVIEDGVALLRQASERTVNSLLSCNSPNQPPEHFPSHFFNSKSPIEEEQSTGSEKRTPHKSGRRYQSRRVSSGKEKKKRSCVNRITRCRGFHMMGFDVMMDDRYKLHLLEINANPSFSSTFMDHAIKSSVMAKTMLILDEECNAHLIPNAPHLDDSFSCFASTPSCKVYDPADCKQLKPLEAFHSLLLSPASSSTSNLTTEFTLAADIPGSDPLSFLPPFSLNEPMIQPLQAAKESVPEASKTLTSSDYKNKWSRPTSDKTATTLDSLRQFTNSITRSQLDAVMLSETI